MNEQHISRAEIARKIDVSDTTISRYLKGNTKPKIYLLRRLATELHCTTKDLYKEY